MRGEGFEVFLGKFLETGCDLEFEVDIFFLELPLAMVDAEVIADAGDDLFELEWFNDIVDRAQIETFELVLGVNTGGEEDDGGILGGIIGFEAAAGFVSVDAGHVDVEEDEFRADVAGGNDGVFA